MAQSEFDLRRAGDTPDLRSDERVLTSFDRGNSARGCRLDPTAFARISLGQAGAGGRHRSVGDQAVRPEEAQGGGLSALIAETLIAGTPATGLSRPDLPELRAFAGEAVQHLPPRPEVILACRRPTVTRASAGSCS